LARVFSLLIVLLALAGCLKTQPDALPLLADVDVAEDAPSVDMAAPADAAPLDAAQPEGAKSAGFLSRLFHKTDRVARPKPRPAGGARALPAAQPASDNGPAASDAAPEENAQAEPAPQKHGLLARIFGKPAVAKASGQTADTPAAPQVASLAVAVEATPKAPKGQQTDQTRRRGLFGPRKPRPAAGLQVPPGTVLPYGTIGIACGISGKALGKQVDRYPERGRGYKLYDTAPGNPGPHTQFLTGFKDGCPRQFTAALALLGAPSQHEALRYDISSKTLKFSSADIAYEKLKRRICKVSRGKPCGRRSAAMDRAAAFLTYYENFGGNARWGEALLYGGDILASDLQSR